MSEVNPSLVKRAHREVRFGNYILGSTLGEGEFGKVKLGWRKDGKLPSQVAIKLIKRDLITKNSESEIKIHREINSLKLLSHPNIVNLVEVMKSGKYIGIVLEYASGGEVFDYILLHKYLKENVAKKLFAQLVSGVDYMHSKGLVHRDLKLENLLLDKHKNIIISDFGFVNSYNRSKGDFMKTSCGSPCYAAPELVLTQSPYEGKKVDIWSLGVILYAMLAGYLPFDDDPENEDGSDIVRLYHYICKTPLTFPEYVTPLARDLLRKIIVPDPKKRIGMDEIRNHPWLAPHANLLSIRQPEWDKLYTKNKSSSAIPVVQPPQPNKRYSMINERTTSSSLITDQRALSSSQLNLYSAPSFQLSSTVAIPENRPASPNKQPFVKNHTKSSSVNYPCASTALKAMVQDIQTPSESKKVKTANYQGTISTIMESSPQTIESTTNTTNTPTATGSVGPSSPPTLPPTPQLASPTPKDATKLPHKKPRPTSYHPLSMSSNIMMSSSTPNQQVLEYMKIPSSSTLSQLFSNSPPKALAPVSETSNDTPQNTRPNSTIITNNSVSNEDHIISTSPHKTRRDSVVTHVHASGELSNHNSPEFNSKRMSVLSYLEDKIDHLELGNSSETIVTPQINQQPTFDTNLSPEQKSTTNEEKEAHSDNPSYNTNQKETSEKQETQQEPLVAETHKSEQEVSNNDVASKQESDGVKHLHSESLQPNDSAETLTETQPNNNVVESTEKNIKNKSSEAKLLRKQLVRDCDKENTEAKETKKKNRFSLLSFYNTGYPSSGSSASLIGGTTEPEHKKILEPSNEANIANSKDKWASSSSLSSSKRSSKTTSTSTSTVNGREASAARKVMDFFKRRSVRIG